MACLHWLKADLEIKISSYIRVTYNMPTLLCCVCHRTVDWSVLIPRCWTLLQQRCGQFTDELTQCVTSTLGRMTWGRLLLDTSILYVLRVVHKSLGLVTIARYVCTSRPTVTVPCGDGFMDFIERPKSKILKY
jgi:hypothetical protein